MSTLSKLPAEIWEMIFEICLPFTWDSRYGRMPSLIVALRARGELKLYFQALEVFRKTNDYDLDAESIELFKTMPETLISTIRKLTITICELNHSDEEAIETQKYLSNFLELTELTIYVFEDIWEDGEDNGTRAQSMLCNWIEAVVPHCPRLKTLVFGRFLSSQLKAGRQLFDLQSLPAPIAFTNNTIEEVNYRLGVEATNRRAHAGPRDVQWQWIAEARKALTWKKRDEGHTEG